MSDELSEALKVVLRHLSDQPKVPAPSITMPLADWQAMVAENERLKNTVTVLSGQHAEAVPFGSYITVDAAELQRRARTYNPYADELRWAQERLDRDKAALLKEKGTKA